MNGATVNEYINKSIAGGIFSRTEGACRASSEYLLAGIPVISTKSIGGRDIWYDDYNSLICEDNPQSVYDCMCALKSRVIDPEIIRNRHLAIADQHKSTLVNFIVDELGIVEDKKVLKDMFRHHDFIKCFTRGTKS